MKKSLLLFWLTVLIASNLTSCTNQIDSLPANSEEVEKLQSQLAVDPVFKAYDDAFKKQMDLLIAQRYTSSKFNKEILAIGMKNVHSSEDYYKLCEKAGIVDAKKNLVAHYQLMLAKKALYEKYPLLKDLSKDDFKKIMFKFSQDIALKSFPKNRFNKSTN